MHLRSMLDFIFNESSSSLNDHGGNHYPSINNARAVEKCQRLDGSLRGKVDGDVKDERAQKRKYGCHRFRVAVVAFRKQVARAYI